MNVSNTRWDLAFHLDTAGEPTVSAFNDWTKKPDGILCIMDHGTTEEEAIEKAVQWTEKVRKERLTCLNCENPIHAGTYCDMFCNNSYNEYE